MSERNPNRKPQPGFSAIEGLMSVALLLLFLEGADATIKAANEKIKPGVEGHQLCEG